MKYFSLFFLLGSSLSMAAMTSLPDKDYTGKGSFRTAMGSTGTYTATRSIKNNTVAVKMNFSTGSVSATATAKFDKNSFFNILDDKGKNVGNGYCFDTWCHASYGKNAEAEETWVFYNGHLYVLGSKKTPTGKVVWEEAY
jgi:hypothetical protein